MPEAAYNVLHKDYAMPLPIPKPVPENAPRGDLHYMSLDEAVKLPFTDEHQPSKMKNARTYVVLEDGVAVRAASASKNGDEGSELCPPGLLVGQNVRGVVFCKECEKPRCIFSKRAPQLLEPATTDSEARPLAEAVSECRNYAKEQLRVATENPLFVCGMQPLDSDHPLYGVFVTRPSVECHDPVEVDYYRQSKKEWCEETLCAYCAGGAGEGGKIDEEAHKLFYTVLPLCNNCRSQGAMPMARRRRKNATARAAVANKNQRRARKRNAATC